MIITVAIVLGAMLVSGALRALDSFNSRRPILVGRAQTTLEGAR